MPALSCALWFLISFTTVLQRIFQFTKVRLCLKFFFYFLSLLSFHQNRYAIIITGPVSSLTHSPFRESFLPSRSHKFFPPSLAPLDPVLYETLSWNWGFSNSHIPELPFTPLHIIFSNICVYPPCFLHWEGRKCISYVFCYTSGDQTSDGPKPSLVFVIFHYIEPNWDDHLLPHGESPGKTRHALALGFPTTWCCENMCMKQWPALGQREIVQFMWMPARGHPTRPLSRYQLCVRSWLMFSI